MLSHLKMKLKCPTCGKRNNTANRELNKSVLFCSLSCGSHFFGPLDLLPPGSAGFFCSLCCDSKWLRTFMATQVQLSPGSAGFLQSPLRQKVTPYFYGLSGPTVTWHRRILQPVWVMPHFSWLRNCRTVVGGNRTCAGRDQSQLR